jgi:hypothetical protein
MMDIRFVSTLTADDEDRIAPSVLSAITSLLDQFSLAYTLRIETTGEKVFQHHHPAVASSDAPPRRAVNPLLLDRVATPGS